MTTMLVAVLATVAMLQMAHSMETTSEIPVPVRASYEEHNPIYIEGNAGFLGDNSSTGISWGSGTASDPYVITGLDINASTTNGIEIRSSDVHFIVEDCHVHHDETFYVAWCIYLYDCTNGILQNNTFSNANCQCVLVEDSSDITLNSNICSDSFNGICIGSSDNCVLTDNTCSNIWMTSISIGMSNNSTLTRNNCLDFGVGITLYSSNNSTLESNTCVNGTNEGIRLSLSNDNTLSHNNCTGNWMGMELAASSRNVLRLNQLSDNYKHGIYIQSGSFNSVLNNTFTGNNGAGGTYDPSHAQAYDDGTSNWWNSTEGYGNYWSDWTTPDLDEDGVVDDPYSIDGGAGSVDHYPLTTATTVIPEFSSPLVIISIVVAMAAIFAVSRRREKRP